jgi:hypothetical protein
VLGAIVAGFLCLGAVGLALAKDVGAWYAFRWALDTAATVGGFPQPHTLAGQIIYVLLIVLGVGALFYGLATLTELIVGGKLADVLSARAARAPLRHPRPVSHAWSQRHQRHRSLAVHPASSSRRCPSRARPRSGQAFHLRRHRVEDLTPVP